MPTVNAITLRMNVRTKNTVTTLGFLLAGVGLLAVVLSLVGIQLSFLTWLDAPGRLFGFVGKLVLVLLGFILIYVGQTGLEG